MLPGILPDNYIVAKYYILKSPVFLMIISLAQAFVKKKLLTVFLNFDNLFLILNIEYKYAYFL